jgi:hypothetical protein
MRFVHRLVIVTGFFLLLPVGVITAGVIRGNDLLTPNQMLISIAMGWIIAGLVIYPIAWLFGGLPPR